MTFPLIVPLDLPLDGAEHTGHASGLLEPLIGFGVFALVVVLLIAALLVLRSKGLLPALPAWRGWTPRATTAPEDSAKQVLAERFARGDLSTEEFLERASALNWTPGGESYPTRRIGRT